MCSPALRFHRWDLHTAVFYLLAPFALVPPVLTLQCQAPLSAGLAWLTLPPSSVLLQKLLFAGSHSQLIQLPLADCLKYRSCADCILARDPYCAWSVNTSRCVAVGSHSG